MKSLFNIGSRTNRFVTQIMSRHAFSRKAPWRTFVLRYGSIQKGGSLKPEVQKFHFNNIFNINVSAFFPREELVAEKERAAIARTLHEQTSASSDLRVGEVISRLTHRQTQNISANASNTIYQTRHETAKSMFNRISQLTNLSNPLQFTDLTISPTIENYHPTIRRLIVSLQSPIIGTNPQSQNSHTNNLSHVDLPIAADSSPTHLLTKNLGRIPESSKARGQGDSSETVQPQIRHSVASAKEFDQRPVLFNMDEKSDTGFVPTLKFVKNHTTNHAHSSTTGNANRSFLVSPAQETEFDQTLSPLVRSVIRRHGTNRSPLLPSAISDYQSQKQPSAMLITRDYPVDAKPATISEINPDIIGHPDHNKRDINQQKFSENVRADTNKLRNVNKKVPENSQPGIEADVGNSKTITGGTISTIEKSAVILPHKIARKVADSDNTRPRSVRQLTIATAPVLRHSQTRLETSNSGFIGGSTATPRLVHTESMRKNRQPDGPNGRDSEVITTQQTSADVSVTYPKQMQTPVEVSTIADTVYRMIEKRLTIEKEWRGK